MSRRFFLVTLASLFIGSSAVAQQSTSTFEILAAGGTNGAGANPHGGLVLGPDGNYYGTASAGGAFGTGTIFKLTPDGILTGLASFPYEQGIPSEALTVGSDGHLYGTTQGASRSSPPGQDIAFRVTLDGQLTTLAPFARTRPGSVEPQRLVEAADGHLYGTTTFGGAEDEGSIFRLTKDGTLTTLMSFTDYPSHGAWPHGGLIEGSNGDLCGTANRGGAFGGGTVFRISKGGDFATIANFELTAATGHAPEAELIEAPDGNFYGVTFSGTSSYRGAVFRMTPAGALSGIAPLPETSVLAPAHLRLVSTATSTPRRRTTSTASPRPVS